jgi:CheY-like chemotaxis protein
MIERVAIVDDDSIFQFTTKVKIEKLQLAKEVIIFHDGEEIFEFLRDEAQEKHPDILLLDINMPMVDGWDFLELYIGIDKDKKSKIKIFMLSSSINPVDVKKASENEFVKDYITKPIKDEDLIRILS